MKKIFNKTSLISLAKTLLIETFWVLLLIGAAGLVAKWFGDGKASGAFIAAVCVFAIGLLLTLVLWKIPFPCILIGGIWMYGLLCIVRAIPLFPIQYLDHWALYSDTFLSNPDTSAAFFCINGILLQVIAVSAGRYLPKYFKEFVLCPNSKYDETNPKKIGLKEILSILIYEMIWLLPHGEILKFVLLYLLLTDCAPLYFCIIPLYVFIIAMITLACFRRLRDVIFGIPVLIVGFLHSCLLGTSEKIGVLSLTSAAEGLPKIVLLLLLIAGTITLQFAIIGLRGLLTKSLQFRRRAADCS